MYNSEQAYHGDELALIGMSGRFPQANSTEAFWRNLCDGMEAISFFDEQTLLSSGVELAMLRDPQYVKARGLLADIELFDANFFDLTPREAEILDPQHRIFLECAWEALEQAGYVAAADDLQIGVFASASMSSYLLNLYLNPELSRSTDDFQIGLANDKDFLSTRIAYKLNLTGPAISVQTACSSSLVALHLACQSVLNGECDLAVAGGVSIHVPQREGYRYLPGDVRSPDGRCRTFDARAQGTVSGSGAAAVVLKRLEDALADGDYIHALIKGSAINNDGSAKIGYTAPSVRGQAQVIAGALTMARVSPETITYVEAHGTGTALGDPIEVAALTEAFRTGTKRNGFCALGSVKTNIGHLDAAAGIAGLIKTVLSLKHGMIPPSLHFEQPNPQIDFANSPFYVNTKLMPWTRGPSPRRAGVSSFGIGGTNAHVVLEEAPPEQPATSARPWQLLLLSAKTDTALEAQMDHLTAALRAHDAQRFADIAYTLQVGRRGFSHRRALVCRDRDDALRTLASRDPRRILDSMVESTSRPVAFLLPGVGDQYVQMAADLYRSEPIFQSHLDRCCTILEPILGRDLRDVLYPGGPGDESTQTASSTATLDLRAMLSGHDSSADEAARMLNQTALSQPAVFAVEYALAQLWSTWGVRPQALLGYSLGEYVAACLAGVLTLEDALTLVARRAQLIQTLPESAMLAVPLAEHDAALLLNEQIFLAAINGPAMCVLAGPVPAITALERQLRERDVAARRLQTRHAFHSPLMRPIALAFAEQLRQVTLRPPTLPYLSNITGTWISPDEATDPEYWVRHLCETVRFADDLQTLLVDPEQVLLEVGPGQSLTSLALQYPLADPSQTRTVVASLRHSYERRSDRAVLLNSAAQLWLAGVALDWPALYRHEERRRVPLPTYPFERQRYWIEPVRHDRSDAVAALHGLRRNADLADWFYLPSWQLSVRPVSTPIAQPPVIGRWLVFMDECGVGRQIVEQLEQTGQAVTLVEVGAQFSHQTEHRFVLDPHKRTDYNLLVAALHESGHLPQRIVHLWNISADDSGSSSPERFAALQPLGFYSLLYLAQALASAQSDPLDIWVIAHGLHCLGSGDRCVPEKATLLGPCKTIPQEYPQITCRSIDIVIPAPGTWQAQQLTRQLMAELWSAADDRMIALRGGARWIPTFAPMRLGSASQPPPRLRQRGVYLITGELARESIAPARYLARTVQARLALVGRTQLPPRDSWSSWLATHDDDVSAGIRGVQELEALGAEVLVISADVADETQMQTALRQVDQHFGALHGVIHAAGITAVEAACSIGELGPDECDRHFRPKVYGLYTLSRLLYGCQLDFCLLTSSIVAIIGGLGQCAYSAASIFMDAFAQQHNQDSPVTWTSLNWEGATLEETEDAFARLLAIEPTAQVIVSSEDLNARIARWSKLDFLRPSQQPARGSSPRPRLRNAYVAPTNPIEQRVVAIFQDILGIDEIGIHDSFFELGGDSLLGMQVLAHARQAFQVELPMRALFELPTAAALSDAVAQGQAQLADSAELARMLEELEQLSETELDALLVENRQNGEGDATDE